MYIEEFPTHLQLSALVVLETGGCFAKCVRQTIGIDGPAFYQLMGRLEKSGWVKKQKMKIADGHDVTQTKYSITIDGLDAINAVRSFYVESGIFATS